MLTLEGRTCVFIGATGQVGRGAVRALCEAGMNVVMVTHNPDSAKAIMESLGDCKGKCIAMSNKDGDEAVLDDVAREFGSVDVIVNKSGGFDAPAPLEEISADKLAFKLNHQITSAFKLVQGALPYLEKSKAGRIILTASAGAQDGFAGENLVDSVSRGGVISMTYALANMLAEKKITVNCIAMSGVINDMPPREPWMFSSESIVGDIPVGRLGTADEYGALVAYLASEEAGFVTGQVMNLSGGLHMG